MCVYIYIFWFKKGVVTTYWRRNRTFNSRRGGRGPTHTNNGGWDKYISRPLLATLYMYFFTFLFHPPHGLSQTHMREHTFPPFEIPSKPSILFPPSSTLFLFFSSLLRRATSLPPFTPHTHIFSVYFFVICTFPNTNLMLSISSTTRERIRNKIIEKKKKKSKRKVKWKTFDWRILRKLSKC